jgi:hypothetical protein
MTKNLGDYHTQQFCLQYEKIGCIIELKEDWIAKIFYNLIILVLSSPTRFNLLGLQLEQSIEVK